MMDHEEQNEWLVKHIPHRVRAATARLPMEKSPLQVQALIDPKCRDEKDKIYWRCATDSIWEGRLAATRWLIEFVGVKQKNGQPSECRKKTESNDVRISDFDGGKLFDLHNNLEDAECLANMWKGCSQASSHATNAYNHPSTRDEAVRNVLIIILNYLDETIYEKAGKNLKDCVLTLD